MQTKQEPIDSLNFLNGTVLITFMFVSVLQQCSYKEEKAVYINSKHDKTVQSKTRTQSCSIINAIV